MYKIIGEVVNAIAGLILGFGPYVLIIYLIRRKKKKKKEMAALAEQRRNASQWEHVIKYLGNKFTEIKMGSLRAVYCYDYYPVGKFNESGLHPRDLERRAEILRFKDGDYGTMAQLLIDFIRGNFNRMYLYTWLLCAVPASTQQKNFLRYGKLMEEVCETTGIMNGFDCIRIRYDRKDSREKKESNTVYNLEFDRERIRGKWVLLIDDITTRGTSFAQCADKLYANGAEFVCGFFMGKTVHW